MPKMLKTEKPKKGPLSENLYPKLTIQGITIPPALPNMLAAAIAVDLILVLKTSVV